MFKPVILEKKVFKTSIQIPALTNLKKPMTRRKFRNDIIIQENASVIEDNFSKNADIDFLE